MGGKKKEPHPFQKGMETHESLAARSSHVPADRERGFPGKWLVLRVAEHVPDEPRLRSGRSRDAHPCLRWGRLTASVTSCFHEACCQGSPTVWLVTELRPFFWLNPIPWGAWPPSHGRTFEVSPALGWCDGYAGSVPVHILFGTATGSGTT